MYVPPLYIKSLSRWDVAPAGGSEVCCCLSEEVYSRFFFLFSSFSCYQATGRAFFVGALSLSTFQVFTQDVGEHRSRKLVGEDAASSLRPPATRLNAYLVLRPPRGDFVGIRSYKHFFFFCLSKKHKQQQQKKKEKEKKMVCIGWKKNKNVWRGVR